MFFADHKCKTGSQDKNFSKKIPSGKTGQAGLQDLQAQVRFSLWDRKPSWLTLPIPSLASTLRERVSNQDLASGDAGIWITPKIRDAQGQPWHIPWLDVEDKVRHHDSIQANIEAAQHLFLQLDRFGLAHGLEIALSGQGTRFMWPFAIGPDWKKAFQLFMDDGLHFPGIDPSPHADNKWFRAFAYRGNGRQSKPPKNVHIHLLDHPAHILDLTEDGYKRLVAGRPDPDACFRWLARILPVSTQPPAEWQALFEHYNQVARLRSHIVTVSFPKQKKKKGIDWGRIWDFLDGKGIAAREMQVNQEMIYRLSECPECGRRDGNPWLTMSGRLKCRHANTCRAGELKKDLQGGWWQSGLTPGQWVDGYTPDEPDQDPAKAQDQVDIETARQRIRDAVAGEGDALVRAAPGVGKTHTTLEEILPRARGELILFTVPTGNNVDEVFDKAMSMAGDTVDIRKVRGRCPENCFESDYALEVGRRGFSPGLIVCPSCQHNELCPYKQQLKNLPKAGLIVAAHETAAFLDVDPDIWIIDENPARSFLQTRTAGQGSMDQIKSKLPRQTAEVLDAFRGVADGLLYQLQGGNDQGRVYATTPEAEWAGKDDLWAMSDTADRRHKLAMDLSYFQPWEDEDNPRWQRRLYFEDRVDFHALQWLWTATGDEQGSAYVLARKDRSRPIQYVVSSNNAPAMPGTRIIALDATGDVKELQALFPGRTFSDVEADVELPGRKVHLKYALGKISVCGDRQGKKPMAKAHIKSKLREGIRCLKPGERRVLIVTHKDARERVLDVARELDPDRAFVDAWDVTHFWGNRGLNAFESCDAVLCFGTPTANPASLKDLAAALFADVDDQAAWIADQGSRDLVQSVHRVRPIYSDKSIIVMGQHWPDRLGKPNFRVDRYRDGGSLEAALDRLRPVIREVGFINRELACVAGVFCGKDAQDIIEWAKVRKTLSEFFWFPIGDFSIGNQKKKNGVFEPVVMADNKAWTSIMDALALETGLPELKDGQAVGSGRSARALGTLSAARKFYATVGVKFNEEGWSGVEELPQVEVDDFPVLDQLPGIVTAPKDLAGAVEVRAGPPPLIAAGAA